MGSLVIVCDECIFDAGPKKKRKKKQILVQLLSMVSANLAFLGQVQIDLEQGVIGAVPIPLDHVGKELVIASLVANVTAMIRADRKVTSLKQLQVSLL